MKMAHKANTLELESSRADFATALSRARLKRLNWKMALNTLIRNPIPVLPHHHLPWRMDAESNGLRSVKQAVSGIGTVGH